MDGKTPGKTQSYDKEETAKASISPSTQPVLIQVTGDQPGRNYCLNSPVYIVGRDDSCGIRIDADGVSRRHCEVSLVKGDYYVADLGSTNGVTVNGKPCEGQHLLHQGDRLALGPNAVLAFRLYPYDESMAVSRVFEGVTKDLDTGTMAREHFVEWLQTQLEIGRQHQFNIAAFAVGPHQDPDSPPPSDAKDVLMKICSCLKSSLKTGAAVGRITTTDFILALPYAREPDVESAWRELRQRLEAVVSYSVGISTSWELTQISAEKLMRESLRKQKLANLGIANSVVR